MRSLDPEHVLKFIRFQICTKILISSAKRTHNECNEEEDGRKKSEKRNDNNNVFNADEDERTVFVRSFLIQLLMLHLNAFSIQVACASSTGYWK